MNSNYYKDIDNIRKNIDLLNKTLTNSINNTDDNKSEKIKNYNGNRYDLSNFQYRVSSMNYKRNLKRDIDILNGKSKENINLVDSIDKLSDLIEKQDYKKKWNKLDNYQKKKKIIQYGKHLVNENIIDEKHYDNLINDLFELLKNKKLKSSNSVVYNVEECTINSIKLLNIEKNKSYNIT